MIDHVTLQVGDVGQSRAFYEALLAPLGIAPGHIDGAAVGFFGPVGFLGPVGFFGPEPGSFWICPAQRGQDRELHVAFTATSRDVVRAFHRVALTMGTEVLHAPRLFPAYHENYFGAFVRDRDGHNIEAVCHRPE
jgi:catechol 2,3-dioxygenase-like lactoylglutathione lyase family enzyme